jgi:lysophospholipase L1-like esterase
MHVVLLGDSIFDNAAYVSGGPDVVQQLRQRLPEGSEATLLAIDGDVAAGVPDQLRRLPSSATHLVVSVGGNDVLQHLDYLERPARAVAEALDELADRAAAFERHYRAMLGEVLARGLPASVCTVYYPRFPEPALQRLAVTALTPFNDAILRSAFESGLPVLDLRLICDEDEDYANPIEPSVQGGDKISRAIVRLLEADPFGRPFSPVVSSPGPSA